MRSELLEERLTFPPEVVSEFLVNLENDPLWRREIVDSRRVEGEIGHVGALYHETVSWEGLQATVPLRVIEYTRGEKLVLESDEPGYRGQSTYRFIRTDSGTTLALQQSLETSGALALIEPFLWSVIARWLGRDMSCIDQAIIEARTAAPGEAAG